MPVKFAKSRHNLPLVERIERFFARGEPDQCWDWQGAKNDKGYGHIRVGKRVLGAHRVMYVFAKGPLADGQQVLHSCDNSSCVNPAHLTAGTNAQNQIEAWARDRKRSVRKLSPRDVLEIRSSSERQNILAPRYGVSQSEISRVRSGTRGHGILSMPLNSTVGG